MISTVGAREEHEPELGRPRRSRSVEAAAHEPVAVPLPLAKGQRPVTSSRPPLDTARPRGANTPPTADAGVP